MKKAKWRTCKITAALLTVLMLMSMFSELGVGLAIPASAAETKNLTIRQADPSTMDDYKTVLDLDSQKDGSRYAGRLWSDKSVFAYGEPVQLDELTDGVTGTITNDSDFLHVYSMMGSSEVMKENVPLDVIISIDITASMINGANSGTADSGDRDDWESAFTDHENSNLSRALLAANSLMQSIHERAPESRISVVVYWGTAYQMIDFVEGLVQFTGYSVRHDYKWSPELEVTPAPGSSPSPAPTNRPAGIYAGNPEAVIHYTISEASDDNKNGDYVYDPVFGDHYKYSSGGDLRRTPMPLFPLVTLKTLVDMSLES